MSVAIIFILIVIVVIAIALLIKSSDVLSNAKITIASSITTVLPFLKSSKTIAYEHATELLTLAKNVLRDAETASVKQRNALTHKLAAAIQSEQSSAFLQVVPSRTLSKIKDLDIKNKEEKQISKCLQLLSPEDKLKVEQVQAVKPVTLADIALIATSEKPKESTTKSADEAILEQFTADYMLYNQL